MSEELVRLAKKALCHPNLPSDIRCQRWRIMSYAHHVAAYYCGNDWKSILRHRFCEMIFNPRRFAQRLHIYLGRIRRRARENFFRIRANFIALVADKAYRMLFILWTVLCSRTGILSRSSDHARKTAKFAFLSHVLPPSWSGQAVVIRRILNGIEPRIYCLISSENYSGKRNFIGRLPSTYHALPSPTRIKRGMSYPAVFKLNTMVGVFSRARHIAGILAREGCTSLVAGTGDLIDIPAACLAAALSGVPFYPYLFDDFAYQWADPVYREMARRFEPVLFKWASGVIVPNEFLQEEIRKRHEVDAIIVRNCCEPAPLEVKSIQIEKKEGESINIVYTGAVYHVNFGAFRNLMTALESQLLTQVYIHLYTAQPEDFLKREGICGPRVVQHPHVPASEVAREHNAADILFIPFSFDCPVPEIVKTSAPGKFGDYLASGTPILAHVPADSFVSWYLRKYDCGIVVDQDDPALLREAILRLIEDADLRLMLSKNARHRAQLDFSPELARLNFLSAIGAK